MANISTTVDLVINRLSQAKYEQLCAAGQLEENQLYMTTGEADITAQISDEYYLKSQTSSASEISDEFKKYQLSGNYLSSNALDSYETYNVTVSSLSNDGYVLSSQITSKVDLSSLQDTLANVPISALDGIPQIAYTLKSVCDALSALINIIKGYHS